MWTWANGLPARFSARSSRSFSLRRGRSFSDAMPEQIGVGSGQGSWVGVEVGSPSYVPIHDLRGLGIVSQRAVLQATVGSESGSDERVGHGIGGVPDQQASLERECEVFGDAAHPGRRCIVIGGERRDVGAQAGEMVIVDT